MNDYDKLTGQLRQADELFCDRQPPLDPGELAGRVAEAKSGRQRRRAAVGGACLVFALLGTWWLVSWRSPPPIPGENRMASVNEPPDEAGSPVAPVADPLVVETAENIVADMLTDIRLATERLDRQRIDFQNRQQQFRRLSELSKKHRELRLAYFRAQLDSESGTDSTTETINLAF